jgi:hypothetical protein
VITVTLGALNSNTTIKSFNNTDKFNFSAHALATGNIDGTAWNMFAKTWDGSTSRLRLSSAALSSNIVFGVSGNNLRVTVTNSLMANQEVKVNLVYYNKI